MHISHLGRLALTPAIAFAALAGCGGIAQMAPTPLVRSRAASESVQGPDFQNSRLDSFLARHLGIVPAHGAVGRSFMDPSAVGKPLLFVSYGGTIDVYLQRAKNKLVGQIAAGGSDLATDAARDLYSANPTFSSDSGNVTIYAPPYTKGPKSTLSGSSALVAVSRQGIVAVGTDSCDLSSGQCSFRFYPSGSTTPCATVALDRSAFPNGVYGAAFDRRENLYAASSGSGTEAPLNVGKIDGGCNATKAKILTTTNSIPYAASIRVDKAGRIAIFTATSDLKTEAIDTYDPPTGASLGSPVSITPLPGSNYNGSFAFQASGLGLWAPNYGFGPSYTSGASEFAYPTGGTPKKTIMGAPGSTAYGVAVTPALIP